MGKPSRVKKLELKAKRAAPIDDKPVPLMPNENTRRAVKDIFRDAKNNRSHGSGSSGGFIPSAKHVEGAVERVAFSVDGTRAPHMGRGFEATERYDAPGPGANRPLDRYRAPSLTVVKAPVRPEITPDYGKRGKGAPAVKAPEVSVDAEIARRNAYARKGDYSGEGPALLPLPPIETIKAYPKPETVRVTVLRGPGLSIVELDGHKAPAKLSFNHAPGRVRALRVRVRWGAAGHMPAEVVTVRRVVWFAPRETRYHPGYDTSAWVHPRSAEELVYRALVIL